MEQETLEEAAEKHLQEWRLLNNIHLSNPIHAERCKNDFIAGAKFQQERMYEIMDLYADDVMGGCTLRAKEWFEQFKKK